MIYFHKDHEVMWNCRKLIVTLSQLMCWTSGSLYPSLISEYSYYCWFDYLL